MLPELRGRWNHNTHYYPLALPDTTCDRALDVGCGDGFLVRLLATRCDKVVGVDPWTDPHVADDLANATVLPVDFLAADLLPGSFDLVCSFTAIHHLPFGPALRRMAALVRPGGRLVVVSVARYTPWSWILGGLTVPVHRLAVRRRGYWQHPAPVTDPDLTLGRIRRVARQIVPGARVRRRLYWRYSIEWTRPGR